MTTQLVQTNPAQTEFDVLRKRGINRPVTTLDSPVSKFNPELYPEKGPSGTKPLSIETLFKQKSGFLFVLLDGPKTYLAQIVKAKHPHSKRLHDETEDITICYADGSQTDLNDYALYHTGASFRTASPQEKALWEQRATATL